METLGRRHWEASVLWSAISSDSVIEGEAKVRVHVPDDAASGAATGVALQIVTDDMPLLVESVVSQLSRLGVESHDRFTIKIVTKAMATIEIVGRSRDG